MGKPRCETCRWWEQDVTDDSLFGLCGCGEVEERVVNEYSLMSTIWFRTYTQTDFGCIFHEERDE